MVSYFIPRGRFLLKAGNLSQAQKHFSQQQQEKKWPILHHFYQSFTSSSLPISRSTTITKRTSSSDKRTIQTENTSNNTSQNQKPKKSKQNTGSVEYELSHHEQQQQQKSWFHWTGFFLRFAPVGVLMISAMEWQWHKHKYQGQEPRRASEFQVKMYCSLPLRIISRCWGWLASCYVPTMFRPLVYGCYSSVFNVNIDEAMHSDYKYYNSLAEFFTRSLREGARPIDEMAALISPADGTVLHFGTVGENSLIEQVKGVDYSLEDFLGPASWNNGKVLEKTNEFVQFIKERNDSETQIYQCVIYLAPGDYHRFHSPTAWVPKLRRHFTGELLSVNPRVAGWMPGLFCLNERALYIGNWEHGFFSYTAVGATNVGSVKIYMDDQLKTNCWLGLKIGTHKKEHFKYDELPINIEKHLKKGELLGQFNMGSTIVLIFEAPKSFVFDIQAGQKVLVGQSLGHLDK